MRSGGGVVVLRILLPAVAAVMLFTSTAAAQPGRRPQPPAGQPGRTHLQTSIPGEGSEFFRALLNVRGIKPLKEQDLESLNYSETIVIVFGGSHRTLFPPGQHLPRTPRDFLVSAVEQGGAGLLASSVQTDMIFWTDRMDISGLPVRCSTLNRDAFLGENSDCPYARPMRSNGAIHQLFGGNGADQAPLNHVVAGVPSYLHIRQPPTFLHPLARFPNECFLSHELNKLPKDALFAVGGESSDFNQPSRFVAFASDHLFINALLSGVKDQPVTEKGTDNLQLAWRTLDYLQGPNHERKKCLFFENGRLIDHFDDLARMNATQAPMPLPSINLGAHQSELVKKANQLIERLETNNVLNRITGREGIRLGLLLFMLFVGAVVAAWYLMSRVFSSRKPSLPAPPAVAPARDGPPGVFERRQREIMRGQNLYEPVREITREFFALAGVHGEPGRKMPPVWVDEEVRRPRSLCLALKDFWKLAYGSPSVLSLEQWLAMEPYFERIRQAHANGQWKFRLE